MQLFSFIGAYVDNRELAFAIWLLLFFLFGLTVRQIRQTIINVVKAFVSPKLIIPFGGYILYTIAIISFLDEIHLWDKTLIFDSVFWLFGTGFGAFFGTDNIKDGKEHIKALILSSLKIALIMEFIFGLYPFSLLIEMLSFPSLLFLSIVLIVIQDKKEMSILRVVINIIILLYSILVLVHSVSCFIADIKVFPILERIREFTLPILLSIFSVPFFYAVVIYSYYDRIFIKLEFASVDKIKVRKLKVKAFRKCGFSLNRLKNLDDRIPMMRNNESIDI